MLLISILNIIIDSVNIVMLKILTAIRKKSTFPNIKKNDKQKMSRISNLASW